MADIKSKNMYELLGNDPELDPDREPEPPTKVIDKPLPRTGKRNTGGDAPTRNGHEDSGAVRGGGHRGGYSGNEQAFRDRGAGSYNNRSHPPDDGLRRDRHPDRLREPREHRDIDGRPRGSRGGRPYEGRGTRTGRDDRHSRTGIVEHEKQAAHGWGGNTGGQEWADEKAGEAIAKEEEKGGWDTTADTPVNADGAAPAGDEDWGTGAGDADNNAADNAASSKPAPEPEPEDKTKSYAAWLAEQAEKKLQLGVGTLEARKPNEGNGAAKKFPEGKPLQRDEADDDFIAGSGSGANKARRDRQRKEKTRVELDDARLRDQPRETGGSFRGGRGRGGEGGGGDRGGRGGGFRGEGRGRGGGRGRGDRGGGDYHRGGGMRGGGGRGGSGPNVADTNAFPSLGA